MQDECLMRLEKLRNGVKTKKKTKERQEKMKDALRNFDNEGMDFMMY